MHNLPQILGPCLYYHYHYYYPIFIRHHKGSAAPHKLHKQMIQMGRQ